jgi:hypothetical protein
VVEIGRFDYDMVLGIGYEFEYRKEGPTEYERILLPLYTPPANGAFGAKFWTRLRIANGGTSAALVRGLKPPCQVAGCPETGEPYRIEAGEEVVPTVFDYDGAPGKFIYVQKDQLDSLAVHVNVRDETRTALNLGTEIPIVRDRDFRNGRVVLNGVGTNSGSRNTLRIYGERPFTARIHILRGGGGDGGSAFVDVTGGDGLLRPAYGAFAEGLPDGVISIEAYDPVTQEPTDVRFWAFISLTNNETQMITTVTPRP